MDDEFYSAVEKLIAAAPSKWLDHTCHLLCSLPATAAQSFVLQRLSDAQQAHDAKQILASRNKLPIVTYYDEALLEKIQEVMQCKPAKLSWNTLGHLLQMAAVMHRRMNKASAHEDAHGKNTLHIVRK